MPGSLLSPGLRETSDKRGQSDLEYSERTRGWDLPSCRLWKAVIQQGKYNLELLDGEETVFKKVNQIALLEYLF